MTSATIQTMPENGSSVAKVYIYGLKEAGSGEFRYIGKTVDPENRLVSHRKDGLENSVNPKQRWIASALSIEMEIIEECEPEQEDKREQYWISFYEKIGHRLTNVRGSSIVHKRPSNPTRRYFTVYFSAETCKRFEVVRDFYGRHLSVSGMLGKLVEEFTRDPSEPDENGLNADDYAQIAGLRADLERWGSDIKAHVDERTQGISLIDERQSLLVEMMRQLVKGGVQADALFCAVEDAVQENE